MTDKTFGFFSMMQSQENALWLQYEINWNMI